MKQALRKGITLLLSLCMAMCFATVAMADDQGNEDVAWIDKQGNKQGYPTLAAAVNAAESGDTIKLAAGTHVLYNQGVDKEHIKGTALTFQGESKDNTILLIGTPFDDMAGESNGDYSLDGTDSITFRNLTLQAGAQMSQAGNAYTKENVTRSYMGFIRIKKVAVENCIIKGFTTYWGYESTSFSNTTFYAPGDAEHPEYALWYYTGMEMNFDHCVFEANGKVINLYREGNPDNPIKLNFQNCTVNSEQSNDMKCALNIKNHTSAYDVTISGENEINGLPVDKTTCSKLFQVKTGADAQHGVNVTINKVLVWKDGEMVDHQYSQGHEDNAFSKTYTNWTKQADGTATRTCKAVCDYCGFEEVTQEVCKHDDSKTVGYVAATCTEDGNKAYWNCSVCGKLFTDANATTETTLEEVTLPKLGHKLTKTAAKAATCTEDGNVEYWNC